ncbi:MAG: YihY/virulence factor BrkB family protein [Bacteroidales bacterium]
MIKLIKQYYQATMEFINSKLSMVKIPGGSGITLYTLVTHFRSAIGSGSLTTRASSISFKFFVALFPGIIFLFTIIPLIPLKDFHETLMLILNDMVPDTFAPLLEKTINDIVSRRQTGLLSMGFILALYFSSSSFISLISSFNQSINIEDTRTGMQQRIISIILMIVTTLLVIIAVSIMILGHDSLQWLIEQGYISESKNYSLLLIGRWFFLGGLIYLIISTIYYLAPTRRKDFRFFSVGSLIATLFLMVNAWGFGFFVKYFSHHNALYGSVGTLLLLLLYIYYNAIILLVGFEINTSIRAAKKNLNNHSQESIEGVV